MPGLKPEAEASPLAKTAEILIHELSIRGLSLAVSEAGTGGALANALTVPGASAVFLGSEIINPIDTGHTLDSGVKLTKAAAERSGADLVIGTVGDGAYHNYCVTLARAGKIHSGFIGSPTFDIIAEAKPKTVYSAMSAAILAIAAFHQPIPDFRAHAETRALSSELVGNVEAIILSLRRRGMKLNVMESCTGGAILDALTNFDTSALLGPSWVAYDERVKLQLGVPLEHLHNGGVYSEKVAKAMADTAREKGGGEIGLATTGLMESKDPRPEHNGTPPGTVYAALSTSNHTFSKKLELPIQSRAQMKIAAVRETLGFLLETLG